MANQGWGQSDGPRVRIRVADLVTESKSVSVFCSRVVHRLPSTEVKSNFVEKANSSLRTDFPGPVRCSILNNGNSGE